jgi:hypothetical protein
MGRCRHLWELALRANRPGTIPVRPQSGRIFENCRMGGAQRNPSPSPWPNADRCQSICNTIDMAGSLKNRSCVFKISTVRTDHPAHSLTCVTTSAAPAFCVVGPIYQLIGSICYCPVRAKEGHCMTLRCRPVVLLAYFLMAGGPLGRVGVLFGCVVWPD